MYAIIRTGSKQYRVEKGSVIDVELLDAEQGNEVVFNEVLLLSSGDTVKVGTPFVQGCTVKGKMVDEVSGPKVFAYKYKKRHNYHRKVGHRQNYSRVEIVDIQG